MTNMLDHVTWSRDQTGYKNPARSHNFQLLAPAHLLNYSRRNSFTLNFELLSSNFTNSLLLLERAKICQNDNSKSCLSQTPIAFHRKDSKTFSINVFARFQLHPIENILKHFQIMSLPNSNCISSKMF